MKERVLDPCDIKSVLAREIPSVDHIKSLPKVLLHEHLDGGLRVGTIIDIAKEMGYGGLPTDDPNELEKWFYEQCNSLSLVKYLECFEKTVSVMQRQHHLKRIAKECVLDLAEDNVIYAEIRYAPEIFVNETQDYDDVITSITDGFQEGMKEVNENNQMHFAKINRNPTEAKYLYPIRVESILCSMRQHSHEIAEKVAELVIKYRDEHVIGMDIAGPENGFPPRHHLDAFNRMRKENMHFTIHAGEDFGLPSIWEAIQICGSDRLGHGVRLVDDVYDLQTSEHALNIEYTSSGKCAGLNPVSMSILAQGSADAIELKRFKLGRLASYVRDRRITLEVCPTSNLQTGCVPSSDIREHPVHLFHRLRFRVTINTDNRLMSSTTMTKELALMVNTFRWTLADIQRVTINAMKSAFIPFDERVFYIKQIIKPAYKDHVLREYHQQLVQHISDKRRPSISSETDDVALKVAPCLDYELDEDE